MEPAVDPILKDLLKKNVIRLTMVDTPFHPHTFLFAKYFLYALKKNNDVEHAFRVRNILFDATADKSVTTNERIEAIFKEKGIPFAVFDVKPVFNRYNALLKEDKINSDTDLRHRQELAEENIRRRTGHHQRPEISAMNRHLPGIIFTRSGPPDGLGFRRQRNAIGRYNDACARLTAALCGNPS